MSGIINKADARIKAFITDIESTLNSIEGMTNINSRNLNGERFLTDVELSTALHLSKRTLLEYRNNGKIPYYHFGGKILYAESDILKILKDNRRECWG